MASIAEWIEKIKTAIYGEEVRGAIWQSLDAMNTQVDAINVDSAQIEQNKQDIATNTAAITALNSSMPKIKPIYFESPPAGQTVKIATNGIHAFFIYGIYRDNVVDHASEGYGIIKIYNNVQSLTRTVGLEEYSVAYDQSTDELSITIPGYCSGTILASVL